MTWLDGWRDSDHRTRIVFITQGIPRESLKDVVDLLDRVSSRTFKARARSEGAGSGKNDDADRMKNIVIVSGLDPAAMLPQYGGQLGSTLRPGVGANLGTLRRESMK
jgi:hypothetical protein